MRVLIHHVNLGQVVAQAGLKVVGIVRGSYLHRSGAKLRLRQIVGNNRDFALHQRQQNMFAVKMRVTFIFGVHRDRSIAQHGLGPGRRHSDEFIAPNNRIANLPQLSRYVLVLHFQVRDRRLTARAPIHNIFAAINQTFFVKTDKYLAHGVRKIFVHGEVFAVPIHRCAQPLHLVEDSSAIVPLPLPNPFNELLTP